LESYLQRDHPESVRRKFVSQTYSADWLRHRTESNVFLVAATYEEVLGFADFRQLSKTVVELAAIYVLPEISTPRTVLSQGRIWRK
jgi:hypothetical protein